MNNICIIGVGLIGGSFALNLKNIYPSAIISGFSRDRDNLKIAKKLGIIDNIVLDIKEVRSADLIVIATPVGSFKNVLNYIKPYLAEQLIIDVGSTKVSIIKDVKNILGNYPRFVPAHPIAGKEVSGSNNADENLFKNKKLIICPLDNSQKDIDLVINIWKKCGAKVEIMDPETHDDIFALTSHLPHLLAFSFINLIGHQKEALKYTGGGLKDFTRIAGSDPNMWADIIFYNKENILNYLNQFNAEIDNIKNLLIDFDYDELIKYIKQANNYRNDLDK